MNNQRDQDTKWYGRITIFLSLFPLDAQYTYGYATTHNGLLSRVGTITSLGTRSLAIGYDGATRVSSISEGPLLATYGYDWATLASGVSITNTTGGVSLQKTVEWDYLNQRPLSIQYKVGTTLVASYAYQYVTNDDRIAKLTLSDGSWWRYQYDAKGHLTSGKRYFSDGSDWFGRQFAYTYDSLGNTMKAGPLSASGVPRYSFTSSGANVPITNRWGSVIEVSGSAATNTTIVVNRTRAQRKDNYFWAALTVPNQTAAVEQEVKVWVARTNAPGDFVGCSSGRVVVAKAVEVPTYDAKSSLISDSRRQFLYTARGWMREALNTAVSPQMRVVFDYYPDGRRARKTVYREGGQGWTTNSIHEFYYDDWNMVAELVTDCTVLPVKSLTRYYTWGLDLAGQRQGRFGQTSGGIGGLLAITEVEEGTTRVFYPVADHNGNIHKLVDGQTGTVIAEYEYDPFGVLVSKTGSRSGSCPFRFMSKYYDAELGLYYFGYRYYDPMMTKWLTLDPLGEEGGINLTAFCRNDPVNATDPLGLAAYFFGGTANNLTDKGWSNVEILYRAWDNDAGHGEKFYVPGVFSGYAPDGTPYPGLQGTRPAMLDEGISGETVKERAEYMMGLLKTQLSKPNPDKEVNVYGFSRGSLTALVFLNMIAKEAKENPKLFEGVHINQTVLLDTVSHADKNLPCDLPENLTYTHQPLHLIAIDEQRKQFFDKNVLDVQGSLQIGFRGVHANVGGGHNNNSLSREPLYFVNTMMKASGMNIFDLGVMDKYSKKYGMIGNDALSTPSKNDTWFYTMGHRDFPAGMFLSAGFMFRKSGLKNDVPDSLIYLNNIDQGNWAQGQRYISGKGWIK